MTETDRHLGAALRSLRAAIRTEEAAARHGIDAGDYSASRAAIARAEAVREILATVTTLLEQPPAVHESGPLDRSGRRNLGRLPAGVKTPEGDFRHPILQALVDLGGSARMADVLDGVEKIIGPSLRPIDREALRSDDKQPRWRNTAQWARLGMVKDGLLRSDSRRGVWEISDLGRDFLRSEGRL